MSATFLLTTVLGTIGSTVIERKVLQHVVPKLFEASQVAPPLPRAFGLVIFILTGFSFWLLVWGMHIGKDREKYMEKAAKDGENPEHVQSFLLPNLYATGGSANAHAFNNIQRSHQHVFETITQVYIGAIIGAFAFPVTSAIITLFWAYARTVWAKSYAAEGPTGRYSNPMSRFIWRGYLANMLLCMLVGVEFLFGTLY